MSILITFRDLEQGKLRFSEPVPHLALILAVIWPKVVKVALLVACNQTLLWRYLYTERDRIPLPATGQSGKLLQLV